ARRTGVRRDTLEAELRRRPSGPRRSGSAPAPPAPPRAPNTRFPAMGAERTLLYLMLRSRDLVERVGEQVGPEDFADPAFRAIFEALLADPGLEAPPPSMDPVAATRLEELLSGTEVLTHPTRIL